MRRYALALASPLYAAALVGIMVVALLAPPTQIADAAGHLAYEWPSTGGEQRIGIKTRGLSALGEQRVRDAAATWNVLAGVEIGYVGEASAADCDRSGATWSQWTPGFIYVCGQVPAEYAPGAGVSAHSVSECEFAFYQGLVPGTELNNRCANTPQYNARHLQLVVISTRGDSFFPDSIIHELGHGLGLGHGGGAVMDGRGGCPSWDDLGTLEAAFADDDGYRNSVEPPFFIGEGYDYCNFNPHTDCWRLDGTDVYQPGCAHFPAADGPQTIPVRFSGLSEQQRADATNAMLQWSGPSVEIELAYAGDGCVAGAMCLGAGDFTDYAGACRVIGERMGLSQGAGGCLVPGQTIMHATSVFYLDILYRHTEEAAPTPTPTVTATPTVAPTPPPSPSCRWPAGHWKCLGAARRR